MPTNEVSEGYVFTPVCQSFCSQGFCLSACWDIPSVPGTPLGADTSLEQTPGSRHPSRSRHPQEQTPSTTPREQTPPKCSACWEIRSTSGQYASYWNAMLLNKYFTIHVNHWIVVFSMIGPKGNVCVCREEISRRIR